MYHLYSKKKIVLTETIIVWLAYYHKTLKGSFISKLVGIMTKTIFPYL